MSAVIKGPSVCPECGSETVEGYGLRNDQGVGSYVICMADECLFIEPETVLSTQDLVGDLLEEA